MGLPLTIPVQGSGILASKASIGKHSETFSQASSNMLPGVFSQVPLLLQTGQGVFCFVLLFFVYPFGHQKSTAHTAHKRKQEMQGGQNGLAVKLSLKEMKETARALPLEAAASVHWAKDVGADMVGVALWCSSHSSRGLSQALQKVL